MKTIWGTDKTARMELTELGFDFAQPLDPENGAKGKVPVYPKEF